MCPYVFGRRRTFPSEHFFCVLAAGASSLRNTFFATRRPARPVCTSELPVPPLSRAAEHAGPPPPAPQNPRLFRPRPAPGPTAERAGPAPAPPQNSLHRPRPAPLNTLAPPPGSTAEPPAPPCPAPLNALAPPRLHRRTPACSAPVPHRAPPLNALAPPRLHRRTPSPSPSRAAEHAGPLPVGAPETSPEGPQHAPESPFRGHLSKSRPRSWVFRGIFRTFGCKWMQKMSFAANNIIRIS